MDREELYELGAPYGTVLLYDHWQDAKNQCTAGVVEYGSRDEAMKAHNELHDRRMDGWDRKITAGLQQRDA
jgi:hypothetical protein